jgi:hypothetical protein
VNEGKRKQCCEKNNLSGQEDREGGRGGILIASQPFVFKEESIHSLNRFGAGPSIRKNQTYYYRFFSPNQYILHRFFLT